MEPSPQTTQVSNTIGYLCLYKLQLAERTTRVYVLVVDEINLTFVLRTVNWFYTGIFIHLL